MGSSFPFACMDPVAHFDIPVDDMEKARAFYGDIFGWEFNDVPLQSGSINGSLVQRGAAARTPAVSVRVQDIDRTIEKVKKAGGSVVMPKTDLGFGFTCDVADPEGNRIGLWQDAPNA